MKTKLFIILVSIFTLNISFAMSERNIGNNSKNISNHSLSPEQIYEAGSVESSTCFYTWATQTSGTTALLYSVSTVSDLIGWTAGVGAVVRRTIDGGVTWTDANPNPGIITGNIVNIYAWSASDAVCTSTPGATFVFKTTNGGTNWTQVYTLAGGFIDALQMISPTEGYGVGDPVGGIWTIIKTTDGGSSWERIANQPTQFGTEAGWNNSFQIMGTNIWFGTSADDIYHSPDLGLTWTRGGIGGTSNHPNIYAVHFNNNTSGLAGGDNPAFLLRSTNGGTSYVAGPPPPGASGNISGLAGSGTEWWAIRNGADVYRSINFGNSWTSVFTMSGSQFSHIDFKDAGGCQTGWAVTTTGGIAKMSSSTVGISNYSSEIPDSYLLKQNFPNPFNPSTNINFAIFQSGLVILKVYDMEGKEVATLLNENKAAGYYTVTFNAANLSSGAYFYRIESNNFIDIKKMLLIK